MTTQTARTNTISISLLILLALLTALDAMAIDMYLPAMPLLADYFNVPAGRIQQTLAVFLAGLAIGQGIYGPLLDRFGRRLPLLIGTMIFVLGSLLAIYAPTVEFLLLARFIQALGAAAGLVTPRAIVTDLCNTTESAKIFSLLMQVMMIAPILAPLAGAYLLKLGDWHLIFWLLAVLGVAGVLWGSKILPDSLPAHERMPLNLRHIMQAYGLQLRQPIFMAYTLAGGAILGSLFAYISTSSFIFTEFFTLTPAQFSYLFAANSVALVIGGQLSNTLLTRGSSTQRVMYLGIATHASAGLLLFIAVYTGLASLTLYIALLALAVGSLGLVFGNITALTMAHAGKQTGIASALMGMLHYLLSAIIGYIISLFPAGLTVLPATIFGCGVLALWLSRLAANTQASQTKA